METRSFTVNHPPGLHARPAAALIRATQSHSCQLYIYAEAKWQPGGIILLMLEGARAKASASLQLGLEGSPESVALCWREIEKLFAGGFASLDNPADKGEHSL